MISRSTAAPGMRPPRFAPLRLNAIPDAKVHGFERRKVSPQQARKETLTKIEFSQATGCVHEHVKHADV